jgi:hypothetical protein
MTGLPARLAGRAHSALRRSARKRPGARAHRPPPGLYGRAITRLACSLDGVDQRLETAPIVAGLREKRLPAHPFVYVVGIG